MKRNLKELVNDGKILPRRVNGATYYILPEKQCNKSGKVGIPRFILKNEEKYAKFLMHYYANRSADYLISLEGYYLRLQEKWSNLLNEDLDTKAFLEIYRAWQNENLTEITLGYNLDQKNVDELKRIGNKLKVELKGYNVIFLEELTLTMLEFIMEHGCPETICKECSARQKCRDKSLEWIKQFFEEKMHINFGRDLPNNKLQKFWKGMRLGIRIPYKYLEDYFSERFFIDEKNSPFLFLKHYEDEKAKEFFYSKIIPLSIEHLVELTIEKSEYLHELCDEYG